MNTTKELGDKPLEINEIAQVGKFDNKLVRINSNDCDPAHVQIIDNNVLAARVALPAIPPITIFEIVILEKGIAYQDTTITTFIQWLAESNHTIETITNLQACLLGWSMLHPNCNEQNK